MTIISQNLETKLNKESLKSLGSKNMLPTAAATCSKRCRSEITYLCIPTFILDSGDLGNSTVLIEMETITTYSIHKMLGRKNQTDRRRRIHSHRCFDWLLKPDKYK